MKVLVVGGSGTVGSAVIEGFRSRDNSVITVHRSSGDCPVDLTDITSVKEALDAVRESPPWRSLQARPIPGM